MEKIESFIKNVFNQYKSVIYSSIIFTIINHFYFFSKRLGNEDDLSYLIYNKAELSSGRWNNGTFITTYTMSPAIKFLLVILILALISVLICDIFDIRSKKKQILTAIIISSFPSLAVSFSYLFMVEIYLLSLIFSVLAVWITIKIKYGWIIGSIFLSLSLGNYQAYISFAVALSSIYIINQIIKKNETKKVINSLIKLLLMGLLGVLLYFAILHIILYITGISLSSYKGANSMGIPPIKLWPTLIYRTYKHFIGFFLGVSYFKETTLGIIVRIMFIISLTLILIIKIIKEKIYKNKLNIILLVIIIVFLPLAINIMDFIAFKTELTSLQTFSYIAIYLVSINLINNNTISKALIILLIIIGYKNFIITNQYYFKQETLYNYTIMHNNRLLNRIEGTTGYTTNTPIMFIGIKNSSFEKELYQFPKMNDKLTYDQSFWGGKYIGYADLFEFNNDDKIFIMLENQFGIKLKKATKEQRESILKSDDIKNMSSYPSDNSVKIIKGVLVVTF